VPECVQGYLRLEDSEFMTDINMESLIRSQDRIISVLHYYYYDCLQS